mmetsp:Transcript_49078/g.110041  ORF Transcript_49078/g.110041 Transcript_49078/m.110041 type:complete len:121 (-) Transcript_49078:73-435(-)
MKSVILATLLASSQFIQFGASLSIESEQDPCTGCDLTLAEKYQRCALEHGLPCSKGADGQKKDYGCCLAKEKHERCLQCKSMDCQYKTCNVNKKYYAEHALADEPLDDKAAMEAAGWGKQ